MNFYLSVMKLAMLFTVVATLQVSAATYAQRVTLKVTNIPLATAIERVKAQTNYDFFLKGKHVADERVSVDIRDVNFGTAMDLLLAGLPLSWVLEDGTIIIQPDRTPAPTPSSTVSAPQRELNGRVTDPMGAALQGVTV